MGGQWHTKVVLQPIFLNRTLTYMKDRMSRTHKRRAGFKVDSLLQKAVQKRECSFIQPGYINLTFLGTVKVVTN